MFTGASHIDGESKMHQRRHESRSEAGQQGQKLVASSFVLTLRSIEDSWRWTCKIYPFQQETQMSVKSFEPHWSWLWGKGLPSPFQIWEQSWSIPHQLCWMQTMMTIQQKQNRDKSFCFCGHWTMSVWGGLPLPSQSHRFCFFSAAYNWPCQCLVICLFPRDLPDGPTCIRSPACPAKICSPALLHVLPESACPTCVSR